MRSAVGISGLQAGEDIKMNILPHEPRVKMIATMLDRCDMAYQKKDEVGFVRLKKQLRNLINASNPRPPKPASRHRTS